MKNILLKSLQIPDPKVHVILPEGKKLKLGIIAEIWLEKLDTGSFIPEIHFRRQDAIDSLCKFQLERTINEDLFHLPHNIYVSVDGLFQAGEDFDWFIESALSYAISCIAKVEFIEEGETINLALSLDGDKYFEEFSLSTEEVALLLDNDIN